MQHLTHKITPKFNSIAKEKFHKPNFKVLKICCFSNTYKMYLKKIQNCSLEFKC